MSFQMRFRQALRALLVVVFSLFIVACGDPHGGMTMDDMRPGASQNLESDKAETGVVDATLVELRVGAKETAKFWWRVFCNLCLTLAMFLAFALIPGSIVGKGRGEKMAEGGLVFVVGLILSVISFLVGTSEVFAIALPACILPGVFLLVWGLWNDSEKGKLWLLLLPSCAGFIFAVTLVQFALHHFKLHPFLFIGLVVAKLVLLSVLAWAWGKAAKVAA